MSDSKGVMMKMMMLWRYEWREATRVEVMVIVFSINDC